VVQHATDSRGVHRRTRARFRPGWLRCRGGDRVSSGRFGSGPACGSHQAGVGIDSGRNALGSTTSEPVLNYSSAPRWRHEVLAASPPALKLNGADATSLWVVHFSLCAPRAGGTCTVVIGERPAGLSW